MTIRCSCQPEPVPDLATQTDGDEVDEVVQPTAHSQPYRLHHPHFLTYSERRNQDKQVPAGFTRTNGRKHREHFAQSLSHWRKGRSSQNHRNRRHRMLFWRRIHEPDGPNGRSPAEVTRATRGQNISSGGYMQTGKVTCSSSSWRSQDGPCVNLSETWELRNRLMAGSQPYGCTYDVK